ncbi:VCBS repeat-containing protein [Streptomyces graminilatus]|uniref:VCBS repeat-containing protein n=1 Tax=Streptomyces graminilatus TaxID=1464070 RepID=UPI001F51CB60|nr:VCBS repeat-containing protein [Streptomyces graminilatus]
MSAVTPAMFADDFNGDGFRDYAVGGHGSVTVTYGTADGPGNKRKTFNQNSAGIPGTAGGVGIYRDAFGSVLTSADFNRDGYADLAVGDRSETVGTRAQQGAVTIVWGSRAGLTSSATRLPLKSPRDGMEFGWALAAGDFNGDGRPDLAVSDLDTVYVYRGGFSKTGTTGKVTKHRPSRSVTEVFQPTGLVAGKVTKDKTTDLYVLGQGEISGRMTQAAWFLRGGATVKGGTFTTYDKSAPDEGSAGVIADFDKNGYGDLAVSDIPYSNYAGSVVVLRGGATGAAGSYRLSQSTAGVASTAAKGEMFGFSLSAGDTDRDGYPDLAVGVPYEKVRTAVEAGGVHVLRGGRSGLNGTGSQWITRETGDVPGKAVSYAAFGSHVRLRDVDRDGDADLLISDYFKNVNTSVMLPGSSGGITTTGVRELPVNATFAQ